MAGIITRWQKEEKAGRIVKQILNFLEGRKGFGEWWEEIEADDRKEIRKEMIKIIADVLPY